MFDMVFRNGSDNHSVAHSLFKFRNRSMFELSGFSSCFSSFCPRFRQPVLMNGYGSFLRVYACAEHFSTAEQDTYLSVVHCFYHGFADGFRFGFLNETDFVRGYMVVFNQFAFDFTVRIPFARLVCPQIAEHELRSFPPVILFIVFGDVGGAVGRLVVDMVNLYSLNLVAQKVEFCTSEVECRVSKVQARTSEVQSRPSKVQARTSEVQSRASKVQARTSEVQSRCFEVQARY
jgi:hypothetical protein